LSSVVMAKDGIHGANGSSRLVSDEVSVDYALTEPKCAM